MSTSSRVTEESGQATALAAALVGLAAILTLAFGTMAGDVVDVARARTAADAAALASIESGRAGATRLASTHGGTIVEWSQQGREFTVTVRVGAAVATARATGGPLVPP